MSLFTTFRTPLKTGGELMCSGRVGISYSTSGTRHVNLVTNPVMSHERGKDRKWRININADKTEYCIFSRLKQHPGHTILELNNKILNTKLPSDNPMLVLNHSPSVLLTKHFASLSSKKFCIHFHIFPCIPDLNNFTNSP
jgi:hypothetical protein